jgi:outer membrane protein OmpA-like peptidoglycan-associated protein
LILKAFTPDGCNSIERLAGGTVMTKFFACLILALAFRGVSNAQSASQQRQGNAPIYQLKFVGNSVTAISYQHRSGSTEIGFQGTPLLAQAKGEARVESKQGRIAISAKFKNLVPAQRFGPEYLTYVLWAITPEGKTNNLGEILLNGTSSKIEVTTSLQTFGLIVSAEPYYAVSQPSNVVVLENVVLSDTAGTVEQVTAKYELLDRGQYTYDVADENQDVVRKTNIPIEVFEARNAVAIARAAGAPQYAADVFSKAQASLTDSETILTHKGDRKREIQSARDAVQNAADARQITIRRREDEQTAAQRAAEAQRTAQAQAEANASATARQQAELQKEQAQLEEQKQAEARTLADAKAQEEAAARKQADLDKEKAELQAQQEAAARAQSDAKAQQEQQTAEQAQQAATQAQQAAAQAEQEKEQLRASLLQQFNHILPTTDTSRGLQVNMADVLFDTGKYNLRPAAREALAKLSGIVEAHPGLKLQVEGFTDSIGSDTFNQTLSENRASAVRAYLVNQGIDPPAVTSIGYGKSNPVASNDTASGRQKNRRVEMIISGEIIGTQIGAGTNGQSPQP